MVGGDTVDKVHLVFLFIQVDKHKGFSGVRARFYTGAVPTRRFGVENKNALVGEDALIKQNTGYDAFTGTSGADNVGVLGLPFF